MCNPCKCLTQVSNGCKVPWFLPQKGWSLDARGYVCYTTRKKEAELPRGKKAHIAVVEHLAGEPLKLDATNRNIHHQDFNGENNCPYNLVLMPSCMNPRSQLRDPHTGEFLSKEAYRRRYGRF